MTTETTVTNTTETTTTSAPAAPKQTRIEKLREKLTKLADQYNAVRDELAVLEALESINVGTQIEVKLGRKFADKDTTRVVLALVVGVADNEVGEKLYKVTYGSGFDAELAVVTSASIVKVVTTA